MSEPKGEMTLIQAEIQGTLDELFVPLTAYTAADVLAKLISQGGLGWGVQLPTLASFSATLTSGPFKYAASTTGAPTANAGEVIVLAGSDRDLFRASDSVTGFDYSGRRAHGTGAITWKRRWGGEDTGDQPPAPRPSATKFVSLEQAPNTAIVLPAGGQWCGFTLGITSATGVLNGGGMVFVETAGGTQIHAALAGAYYKGFAWRTMQ
jgi:hypothetical protein